MDKGAHFRRCDFQVHTPRDLNWDGERPVTEDERRSYAKRFIKACREKGLDAVAITDHHDFGFFPYIRDAARQECDESGTTFPVDQQIVVFPGMELTLGVPCQAILILDAEFPVNLLPAVCNALTLTPNDAAEVKHADIQRLGNIRDLRELHQRLDEYDFIRGRYILLPNISSGGKHTLQREGFLDHYKTMPCVGGYLDGPVSQLGVGDRKILDGKVAAYNNKPLGIFPTSDNRQEDFGVLGDHTAWVKWAQPTAEALRQACLARSTRILHEAPQLPSLVIESLHVTNSKFMGPIDLYLNSQFNCLIGGRGTGKSTILEYLRWGLCDQPPANAESDESPNYQAKRNTLINNTLKPLNATVDVHFSVNGVKHLVRRKTDSGEVTLKVGDDPFKIVRESDIRDLLPLHAYSQKQLSAVGVRSEELLRFVESPVRGRLNELQSLRSDHVARIRSSYGQVQRKKALSVQITRQEVELVSLEKQVDQLQKGLKGLSEDDQQILANQKKFLDEQSAFQKWDRNVERLNQVVGDSLKELASLPSTVDSSDQAPNQELLGNASTVIASLFSKARSKLEEAKDLFKESSEDWRRFGSFQREWIAKFEAHEKLYEDVKEKAVEHEAILKQISQVEARIKTLKETIAERTSDLESYGSPELEYKSVREQWVSLFRQKADLLEERCAELTTLSNGSILATLKRGAGAEAVINKLQSLLEGTGIRTQAKKLEDLRDAISEAGDSLSKWHSILDDLEVLATIDFENNSDPQTPATTTLSLLGFNKSDIERIAKKLTVENWLELSLVELEDSPAFHYRLREDEYVNFADASAGQQATALLRVLLNQQGPPLVIDQPEDDLDNQVILKIVEEIWSAKKNRQIIFSSHNANVVVNGDADLVVCCDYRTTSDQSGGKIKSEGAIDVPEIRGEITQVMEGGKTAFLMRQDKYGF